MLVTTLSQRGLLYTFSLEWDFFIWWGASVTNIIVYHTVTVTTASRAAFWGVIVNSNDFLATGHGTGQ